MTTQTKLCIVTLMAAMNLCCFSTAPLDAQVIVGHRGASYDAPENTLAAFKLAWEQQADGIEGDFYVTKDQQVVCIHDADTKRTAAKKLVVAQATLAELRSLEYGAWKNASFSGEPIPTFEDVLAIVPAGKLFVIELKVGPEIVPLIKPALEKEHQAGTDKKFLFISFNADTIAKCKELLPTIRAHWLTGFKQDKQTGRWTPEVATICDTVTKCKADGVGLRGERAVIDQTFIDYLKNHGCREFHVWTIDEVKDAAYFQGLGAVGITTNRPAFIRAGLATAQTSRSAE